ncbi:MAG: hypothetical protein ACTSV1_09160 [Alphaproteobacteria bacterium]
MRYQVRYVEQIRSWVVVDSKIGDKVLALHDKQKSALDAAHAEEERWYKCSPSDDFTAAMGMT